MEDDYGNIYKLIIIMITIISIVIIMSLLNLIRKDAELRRIFGKKELQIIEKQLLGINLEASERTRLSRDIRKKFQTIKKFCEYESEFELKKGAEIKKLISEAKEIILESKYFSRIKRIILFGSAVENKLTFRSDIDIAIEFYKIDVKESTQFRVDISQKVNDKIDIQVYNSLPDKIKKEIDKKGRTLYARNADKRQD